MFQPPLPMGFPPTGKSFIPQLQTFRPGMQVIYKQPHKEKLNFWWVLQCYGMFLAWFEANIPSNMQCDSSFFWTWSNSDATEGSCDGLEAPLIDWRYLLMAQRMLWWSGGNNSLSLIYVMVSNSVGRREIVRSSGPKATLIAQRQLVLVQKTLVMV